VKRLVLFILVFLASYPAYAGDAKYSFNEVLRLALERAERLKIAQEDIRSAEALKERAYSALLPKVSIFGEGRRYTESKTSGTMTIQPETMTIWGIRAEQAVSLGGREVSAFRATEENLLRARYDLESVKEQYLFDVASLYYAVLRAKKSLAISESNVERLKKHRDAAEARLRAGEATKTALLRAEAELSGAEAKRIDAQNRLLILKAELARASGIEGDFDIDEADIMTFEPSGLDAIKLRALSNRKEVFSAEKRTASARQTLQALKGAYYPILSVEGVYSKREDDPTSPIIVKESIYGGLKISFLLFDGGQRAGDILDAKSRLRQAELLLEDTKKTISLEAESSYLEYMTQRNVIEAFSKQLSFARDNYSVVSRQFALGLATSTDVMDANNLLVTAENQYSDALYLSQLAALRLLRATGDFIEKTIGKER